MSPKRTPLARLYAAMRQAIAPQTKYFKDTFFGSMLEPCPLCQSHASDWHVDHITPFKNLATHFIGERVAPRDFDFSTEHGYPTFLPEDKDFEKAWADFHQEHARLRLICKPCNLKKRDSDDSDLD
jgi:5-methylcytosine-specific restriction endonuclease McrA